MPRRRRGEAESGFSTFSASTLSNDLSGTNIPSFRARMEVVVDLAEAGPRHVSVNLGRRNVGVAEKHLNRAQVGSVFEHVGGKRVAKDMGRDVRPDSSASGILLDELPEALARHRNAPPGQEQVFGPRAVQPGTGLPQVAADPFSRVAPDRNETLLVPLSHHEQSASLQVGP